MQMREERKKEREPRLSNYPRESPVLMSEDNKGYTSPLTVLLALKFNIRPKQGTNILSQASPFNAWLPVHRVCNVFLLKQRSLSLAALISSISASFDYTAVRRRLSL